MLQRCLVTGGAGFVGSNLIKALKSRTDACEIVSLDNYISGSAENHIDGVEYISGNTWEIRDITRLQEYTPTVIFHFGEFSRIVQSFSEPQEVFTSNALGTPLIALYAIEKKAKLVYSGSTAIFGNEMADQHLNPYAWTKAKNIELLRNMHDWFQLDFACCYFYNVFGPGQISTGSYATVIGIFEHQLRTGQSLTVVEPGTQTRAFTHVDDIVNGVIAVALKGIGDGYLLGTTENLSIIEVAKMFKVPYTMIPQRRGERMSSCILPSRARDELGWMPSKSLEEYVSNIISERI